MKVLKIMVVFTIMFSSVLFTLGCSSNSGAQTPYWAMTWSCGNNSSCASSMHAWYVSGSFASETDCLAWETGFINSYSNSSVTSCTEEYQ